MSYRVGVSEVDLSGFVSSSIAEIGAMLVTSQKGKKIPVLCQTDTEVIDNFGYLVRRQGAQGVKFLFEFF